MKQHPLVRSLLNLRGNPRACVYTEPLWGIPRNLHLPFVSVYMAALGVSDRQIGLIASITLLTRAISAVFSGALTDKLGRRWSTFIFDFFAWSLPCLLWMFSQNFWWFAVSAAFNGMWQLTDISWTCLLVEDAEKSQMVSIFSWVHISGQLAVFFAPVSALLIRNMNLVPAVRIIYFFSFLCMTAKFVILYIYSEETDIGKARMRETKGSSVFKILSGYKYLLPRFFSSGEMMLALALTVLFQITRMVMDNFFGLYATLNLNLSAGLLAYFPIIRSLIMMLFIFGLQSRLLRFGYRWPMLIGAVLYILSHLLLLFFSRGNLAAVISYTVLEACAHALVIPRRDSLTALFIDPQERARITSIMTVIVLAISIPFGYISGLLSSLDRRLPFILNLFLFAVSFMVILTSKSLSSIQDDSPK